MAVLNISRLSYLFFMKFYSFQTGFNFQLIVCLSWAELTSQSTSHWRDETLCWCLSSHSLHLYNTTFKRLDWTHFSLHQHHYYCLLILSWKKLVQINWMNKNAWHLKNKQHLRTHNLDAYVVCVMCVTVSRDRHRSYQNSWFCHSFALSISQGVSTWRTIMSLNFFINCH